MIDLWSSVKIYSFCYVIFLFSLRGAAKFEVQDGGVTVLYLNGSEMTYAETPALPIQNTDLTIAVWIKLVALSNGIAIYSDWSKPHHFWFFIVPNEAEDGRLCATARRAAGEPISIFSFCTK